MRLGTGVDRIDRGDGGWIVRTSGGDIHASQVVVATGYEREPLIPDWSGRDGFKGRLLHSCAYKNPDPFRGSRVLVVGPGCSGMEIAYDLVEGGAAEVWLSVRTPPNILLREGPAGLPGDYIGLVLLRFPVRFADAFTNFGRRMERGGTRRSRPDGSRWWAVSSRSTRHRSGSPTGPGSSRMS